MNVIDVNASVSYPVVVGGCLLKDTGEYIRRFVPAAVKAAVITDDTVDGLYGDTVRESVRRAGLDVCTFVLPHGEASKNGENYLRILSFLAAEHITRSDAIAALGGGVAGDIAGFAAATYLRGIGIVQIPTTLLAQVDSSVGGKTAIDLPEGKNLAGAFYQPALVLCDTGTLDTLPEEVFIDGCAEAIKYGILGDEKLFEHLKEKGPGFDREYVISRCIESKRDLVMQDEFDRGRRRLLNLGHTTAHAAEKLSDYSLSHGRAVAMGIASVARAAAADGTCSADCAARIVDALRRFGLPDRFGYPFGDMYRVMLCDKKIRGNVISLVVPEEIGRCVIRKCTLEEMKSFFSPAFR
ncbi:MAG: 3-dehydroquinate synthase [Clostridia bacterium]|nr:3-dehydroquinate synthase [Clostridia bacterium]